MSHLKKVIADLEVSSAYPRTLDFTVALPEWVHGGPMDESHVMDLWDILRTHYAGQNDPIYAVQSRNDPDNVAVEELFAIKDLLKEIIEGKFDIDYEREYEEWLEDHNEEQESWMDPRYVAQSWLPTIEKLIEENRAEYDKQVEEDIEFRKKSYP